MIIKTKFLPKGIIAITLFPFIFTRQMDDVTLNHEKIHLRQQMEMLIIFFYIWYLLESVFKGYKNISFEKEAYEKEGNMNYLKERKAYSWINFIK